MAENSSRRVPKQTRSQERFDKIVEVAANLFLEKGFDGTTTNEIARRADISIGSLYQYFNNKESIVAALSDRYVEAFREVTADVVRTDVAEMSTEAAVDALLDPILEFHLSFPEFRMLWLGTEVSPELRASMRAMDDELTGRVEELLKTRVPGISSEDAKIVVTAMNVAVKSLLALLGRPDHSEYKVRVAADIKRMLVLYVDDLIRRQDT